MNRRYPRAKWTLPAVVDPAVRRCFKIPVPDDPMHIAAFRGALLALASAYKWQDDSAHTAVDVANVWREIYGLVIEETCDMSLIDVRQNDELPCTLEKTFDGATWSAWANLQLCPPRLRSGPTGGLEWFDGSSWVPLPDGGDERQDGGYDPPWPTPPGGQSGHCLAAENIVAIFETSMLQGKVALEAGMIGFGIIAAIGTLLSPFIPAAIFTTVAAAIGGMIFDGGVDFLTDVTSTDNLDAFKCAINCKASADGSITASQFNDIRDRLDTAISDATIRSLYQFWMDGLGPVGMSRMGAAAGITTGSCDSCDCGQCSTVIESYNGFDCVITKTGCHYHITSVDNVPDDAQIIVFRNADIGTNFNITNVVLSEGADYSAYYNGSGDPHVNVGIVGPLHQVVLAWSPVGHAQTSIDFDLSD